MTTQTAVSSNPLIASIDCEREVTITIAESWARVIIDILINGEDGPLDHKEATQCRLTLIKAKGNYHPDIANTGCSHDQA